MRFLSSLFVILSIILTANSFASEQLEETQDQLRRVLSLWTQVTGEPQLRAELSQQANVLRFKLKSLQDMNTDAIQTATVALQNKRDEWTRAAGNANLRNTLSEEITQLRSNLERLRNGEPVQEEKPTNTGNLNVIAGLDKIQQQNLAKVQLFLEKLTKNPQIYNVHNFNHDIFPYRDLLMQCNKAFGLTPKFAPEQSLQKLRVLRAHCLDKSAQTYAEKEIVKIGQYLHKKNGMVAEKETGLCPTLLLSCCVDFMEKSPDQINDVFIFLRALEENTRENGGCYPGYVGRMAAFNYRIIFHLLAQQHAL